jgi:hypothetical protein
MERVINPIRIFNVEINALLFLCSAKNKANEIKHFLIVKSDKFEAKNHEVFN